MSTKREQKAMIQKYSIEVLQSNNAAAKEKHIAHILLMDTFVENRAMHSNEN